MLRNLNKSSGGRRILGTWNVGIAAATIAVETATGDSGPGLLYDDALQPANAGKQLRCRVTGYTGTPSALFVYENGAVEIAGEANGSYVISYSVDADNIEIATDTAMVTIGAVDASAGGGAGTVTITGYGGEATGGVGGNAYAEGGTGVITITGAGGEATGVASGTDASADGGIGTVAITGSGGEATGGVDGGAYAEGGTGVVTIEGTGGQATGGGTQNMPDFVKAWCRIDSDEFDAVLPTMIASAVNSASHETGVDYRVEEMPESVKMYCAALVAQWLSCPEAGAASIITINPFLSGLLDPHRLYL